jgi:hypothetical protein
LRQLLSQVKPPSAAGLVRAGEFVSPVPGLWSGGWQGEFSEMQLAACATAAGQNCTTLTDPHYARNCSVGAAFALDPRFAGGYLRVAQRRIGPGPPVGPSYAVTSPYGAQVLPRNPITSVVIAGQIAPPVSPAPRDCGPPPPARTFITKQGVAVVECPAGCLAVLVGSRDGQHWRTVRSSPEQNALIVRPAMRLRLPCNRLVGSKPESTRLVVQIDGKRAAQRTIRVFPH